MQFIFSLDLIMMNYQFGVFDGNICLVKKSAAGIKSVSEASSTGERSPCEEANGVCAAPFTGTCTSTSESSGRACPELRLATIEHEIFSGTKIHFPPNSLNLNW